MVGATGIPRTAQGCRLWGTRNDLIALYLSNLLVVEPWHTVNVCDVESGRQESNLRPLAPHASTLPG